MSLDPSFDFILAATAYGVAAGVSLVALARGALTGSGGVAAALVGGTVLAFGGLAPAVTLVAFFVSSSLLSSWMTGAKWDAASDFSKGSRRDALQVFANGAVAAIITVVAAVSGAPLFPAFVGAVAAATADTWATELGLLSRVPPRMLIGGTPVRPGTSGAVTPLGSAAAAAGGIFIGLVGLLAAGVESYLSEGVPSVEAVRLLIVGPTAGIVGATVDSLLGATVQCVYKCPRCEKETERLVHSCGTPAKHVRGVRWLSGDVVNLAATFTGALVGLAVGLLF